MELHGDRLVVSIIEQNTVFLCCGHLRHTQTCKDTPIRVCVSVSADSRCLWCHQRATPSPHLQCDVGLRPVLDVLQLNVRVSVHEVNTDQLLAALTLKARQALTDRSPRLLHTGGAVLTLSQLAGWRRRKAHFTKLTTEGKSPRACERVDKITAITINCILIFV